MVKINENLSGADKVQIYSSALWKVLRGIGAGLLMHKHKGLLFVGKHVHIFNRKYISVGRNVKFEDYAEIQGLSVKGLHFKDGVTIGRNTQIRPSSYYGVGIVGAGLSMGRNSSIGPNGFIGCAGMIHIGNDVMVGPGVTMIAENHNFTKQDVDIKLQGVVQKGIVIEDNVWIGANVTILDGVTIGEGSVIGGATLVNKDIPSNSVYYNKRDNVVRTR